jgi:hypothetical protein
MIKPFPCDDLPPLLPNPAAEFNPNFIQQLTHVLIPFGLHQVEV